MKATYALEGDSPLALIAYEHLSTRFHVIRMEHYPNMNAVANDLSREDSVCKQQLVGYAKTRVEPAYSYLKTKFNKDLKPAVLAFEAARYFSPSKLSELKATARDIDSLRVIPFLD